MTAACAREAALHHDGEACTGARAYLLLMRRCVGAASLSLISFDDGAMTFPEQELPDNGNAQRDVSSWRASRSRTRALSARFFFCS